MNRHRASPRIRRTTRKELDILPSQRVLHPEDGAVRRNLGDRDLCDDHIHTMARRARAGSNPVADAPLGLLVRLNDLEVAIGFAMPCLASLMSRRVALLSR